MNVKKIILTLLAVVCVLSCLTLPALAAEYPVPPSAFENEGRFMLKVDGGYTYALLYDTSVIKEVRQCDHRLNPKMIRFEFTLYDDSITEGPIARVRVWNGTEWSDGGSFSPHNEENGTSTARFPNSTYDDWRDIQFLESPIDIYKNGALFFKQTLPPTPLWVEILGITEANKNLLNQNQTLLILTIAGVSLIALVLCLSLFGKVLKRFQAR